MSGAMTTAPRTAPKTIKARATELLAAVAYKDWSFLVRETIGEVILQVAFTEADTVTGERTRQYGRKWRLGDHMTDSEIVQTALAAVLAAEEHEAREKFLFEGEAIFGPHFDVRDLVRFARNARRDARPPMAASSGVTA